MALILKSDTTIDSIPVGTPALPPEMALRASDTFTGPNGTMAGRALDNGLGGDLSLTWQTPGYEIVDGTAHPGSVPGGTRASIDPGMPDYAVSYTHRGWQSGSLLTVNLRNATTALGQRARVAVEKTSIALTEVATTDGAPEDRGTVPYTVQVGDEIAVGIRGTSSVEVAVWVNWESAIPWTAMENAPSGGYFTVISGLTKPGPVMDDFRLYELM